MKNNPVEIAELQSDSAELNLLEDGIYRRLLDWYCSKERPIPGGRAHLIVRATTEEEVQKTYWVLSRFFEKKPSGFPKQNPEKTQWVSETKPRNNPLGFSDEDFQEGFVWVHALCEKEIQKRQCRANIARLNGKKSTGRPRKKPVDSPEKTQRVSETKPRNNPLGFSPDLPPSSSSSSSPPTPPSSSPSHYKINPSLRSGSQGINTGVSTQEEIPSSQLTVFTSETVSSSKKKKTKNLTPSKGGATWDAYSTAYRGRYGVDPVRNAKTNSLCANIVNRLGSGDSPQVATFYLSHNGKIYIESGHALTLLLRDAEKLRTEWFTGRRMTSHEANENDRLQGTGDAWMRVANRAEERAKTKGELQDGKSNNPKISSDI